MNNDTPIIIELREAINHAENMGPFIREEMILLFESAQSEIETLTDSLKQMKGERDDAQVDQRLIEELWERRTDMTEMKEQIKLLRKERDEARQLACEFWVMDGSGYSSSSRAKEDAIARGWDCYKTKETP
jgi:hypothetical protein